MSENLLIFLLISLGLIIAIIFVLILIFIYCSIKIASECDRSEDYEGYDKIHK